MLPRCGCGEILWSDIERDYETCNRCQQRQIDKANRRREWDYYHPDDEMPESENV